MIGVVDGKGDLKEGHKVQVLGSNYKKNKFTREEPSSDELSTVLDWGQNCESVFAAV